MLDENPVSLSSKYKQPHYLALDTNIILDQVCMLLKLIIAE